MKFWMVSTRWMPISGMGGFESSGIQLEMHDFSKTDDIRKGMKGSNRPIWWPMHESQTENRPR